MIQPHGSIHDIEKTDLIVIGSATDTTKILKMNPELISWLKKQYDSGAHIASICTGVFLLAETGLLDGEPATLHWGFSDQFKARSPQIKLDLDRMMSAGVSAGMDLTLFCGRKAAVKTAKTMVLDLGRNMQAPYSTCSFKKSEDDPLISKVQSHIEKHWQASLDYDELASQFNLGRRSLERRFKKATGMTPLGYVQHLRVEQAKLFLEEGEFSFSEITYQAGYEDVSFFRKLFTRITGLKPKEYQRKFKGF